MSAVVPVMRAALPKRPLAVAVAVVLAAGIGIAGWQDLGSTSGSAKQHSGTDGAGVTLPTPGVLDYPVADATRVLTQQGFRVQVQPVPDRGIGVNPRRLPPMGTVLRQTPAPFTGAPRGTLVTLFVRAP